MVSIAIITGNYHRRFHAVVVPNIIMLDPPPPPYHYEKFIKMVSKK